MHIEFVGLPGAGKTTMVSLLKNKLTIKSSNNGRVIFKDLKRHTKLQWLIQLIKGHPSRKALWLALQCSLETKPVNISSLKRFIKTVYIAYTASLNREDILLYDELMIQRIWSAVYVNKMPSKKLIVSFLKALEWAKPEILIWVDIDIKTAIDRISNRNVGYSRYDMMHRNTVENHLSKINKKLRYLLVTASEVWQCKIVEIDGKENLEDNVNLINKVISKL